MKTLNEDFLVDFFDEEGGGTPLSSLIAVEDTSTISERGKATFRKNNEAVNSLGIDMDSLWEDEPDYDEAEENYDNELFCQMFKAPKKVKTGKKAKTLLEQVPSSAPAAEKVGASVSTPYSLAQTLMSKVRFVLQGEALYFFNGVVYELLTKPSLDRLILQYQRRDIELDGKPEIIKKIAEFVKAEPNLVMKVQPVDADHFVFLNGRVDLHSGRFEKNGADIFQTAPLDFSFDEEAQECPFFDMLIENITDGDEEYKEMLYQSIGYIVSSFTGGKKFFVLFGQGDTGKSVFINMLSSFFSEEFISNVDLQDLGGRFNSGCLVDKRLKAIPHRDCARIAQPDFSSDCTN